VSGSGGVASDSKTGPFPQYLDQVLFGLVERDADQAPNLPELIGRVDKLSAAC